MPAAHQVIAHILHHVNAEAADSDPSQVAGVAERAQYVRDAVRSLATDTKDRPRDTILQAISDDALSNVKQASFRRSVVNMKGDDGVRPQLAIQTWVGKGLER